MKKESWNESWEFCRAGEEEYTRMIDLPYDAMIYEKRQPRCINSYNTGYYPGGSYIYTKKFLPLEKEHMVVEFEGVYGITEVYLNEEKLAENVYGYTNFYVSLDSALHPGEENILTVKVDNSIEDVSRWYSGSGIYRDVNLYTSGELFIQPESFRITPISVDGDAVLEVEAAIENRTDKNQNVEILVEIYTPQNILAKQEQKFCELRKKSSEKFQTRITVANPVLWCDEMPALYKAKLKILSSTINDADETAFGIRILEWDAERGFFVNGKETKLRGCCVHHDNGMLGANTNIFTERRKAEKIKKAGFNAVRSAHNPAGKLFMQACDEIGLYVMDEAFDIWYRPKGDNYFQYCRYFETWWRKDIQSMVRKDYNHPSVIMYSIGNEIFETAFKKGIKLAAEMKNVIKQIDRTRPVTCCVNLFMNGMAKEDDTEIDYESLTPRRGERDFEEEYTSSKEFNILMNNMKSVVAEQVVSSSIDEATKGVFEEMDISGYNYGVERYGIDQRLHPQRIIVGSETVACDIDKNWMAVTKWKNVIGDFIWTGYDYLGECGIGVSDYKDMSYYKSYPFRTSGTGVIGINGNFTPLAYFAQIAYGIRKAPYLVVEPFDHSGEERSICSLKFTNGIHSWDWKGCEGKKSKIYVFSSADSVELYINDFLVGKKKRADRNFVEFEGVYEPGKITAKTYDSEGKYAGEDCLETPGQIKRVVLEPEFKNKKKGSFMYVPIRIEDENGILHNINNKKVSVKASGAELIALGTEAPCSEEDFHGSSTTLYQGQAMAIFKILSEHADIQIEATCEECQTARIVLKSGISNDDHTEILEDSGNRMFCCKKEEVYKDGYNI